MATFYLFLFLFLPSSCAMNVEDEPSVESTKTNLQSAAVKHEVSHPEENVENFIVLENAEECGINFASKTCEQPPYVCEEGNELATCVEE